MRIILIFIMCFSLTNCKAQKENTQVIPKAKEEVVIVNDEVINENEVDSLKVVDSQPEEIIIVKDEEIIEDAENEQVVVDEVQEPSFNHDVFNDLLQKHVSDDGNVNYKAFKVDKAKLIEYLQILSDNLPTDDWSKDKKLAYWINAYNAMTVKLIIDNYPTKSIKDIKDPWKAKYNKLGKKWYSLNEIEHEILRKMNDPKIHFGINCASYSCPRLLNKTFTEKNVQLELEKLTFDFVNDTKRNKLSKNKVELSKIFQWFTKDFTTKGKLIDYIIKYSDIEISKKAKIIYLDYNWNLNE